MQDQNGNKTTYGIVCGSLVEDKISQIFEDINSRQYGMLDAWVDERMMTLIFCSGEIAILK